MQGKDWWAHRAGFGGTELAWRWPLRFTEIEGTGSPFHLFHGLYTPTATTTTLFSETIKQTNAIHLFDKPTMDGF